MRKDTPVPKISIVLPVYQGAAFIRAAVESVLAQTMPDFELIVVDNGSTDGSTARIVNLLDSRIRIFRLENTGVACARNFGINRTRTDWIAFIDADDRWMPEKLATDIATIALHGGIPGIVYGGYYVADHNYNPIYHNRCAAFEGMIFEDALKHEGLFLPSAVTAHRYALLAVGGFEERCPIAEDRVTFLRMASQFPAFPTHHSLTIYRRSRHGRQRTILADFVKACEAEQIAARLLATGVLAARYAEFERQNYKQLVRRLSLNGYMDEAQRLAVIARLDNFGGDIRGKLTKMALATGLNLLPLALFIGVWRQSIVSLFDPQAHRARAFRGSIDVQLDIRPSPLANEV